MPAPVDLPFRPTSRRIPPLSLHRWTRRARRSPVAWAAAAASVAVVAFARVSALDDEAEDRRRAWGTPVGVVVAAADLTAGEVIGAGDITVEEWPAAMVPNGALTEAPTGRTVTAAVVAGEAVVGARVAPAGLTGTAALIPQGHRAVAVPTAGGGFGTEAPPLAVGDRVDVLATFDTLDGEAEGEGGGADPTGAVAEGALVIDVGDVAVTVAVPEADATRVAFAAARGTITLALVGAS